MEWISAGVSTFTEPLRGKHVLVTGAPTPMMEWTIDVTDGIHEGRYATTGKHTVPHAEGVGPVRRAARSAVLSLLGRTTAMWSARQFLRCVYCHHVFADQAEHFGRILSMLERDGKFLDTETAISMAQGNTPIDGRYYHLSFDDGFKNMSEIAAPILRARGIPAIFFVPTRLIGADWKTSRDYSMNVTRYRAPVEVMSWNDVDRLVEMGFEVGSHTRTHARLSALSSGAELADEIAGSREDLRARYGDCAYISWPFGSIRDVSDQAIEYVRAAGYRACFGAYRGSIAAGRTDLFRIPRHHFEAQWAVSHVRLFAHGFMEKSA